MKAFASANGRLLPGAHARVVHGTRAIARVCVLVAVFASSVALVGCNQGQEGDRCNPDLSHNECDKGLTCQQPPQCPENYCCPASGESSNPNCQAGCTPGGVAALCATDPAASACVDSGTDAGADAEPAVDSAAPTGDTGSQDAGAKDGALADAPARG
jgi:hypothetical protein